MSNILRTSDSINAFAIAQAALLNCRVAGMHAENENRIANGLSIAYDQHDFAEVEREFEALIGSNELLALHAKVNV